MAAASRPPTSRGRAKAPAPAAGDAACACGRACGWPRTGSSHGWRERRDGKGIPRLPSRERTKSNRPAGGARSRAKSSPSCLQPSRPTRAIAYLVAATSGLRPSELGALTWGGVDADAWTLRVGAAYTKNRTEAVQPIPAETMAALLRLRGTASAADLVFPRAPSTRQLRTDLKAAGLAYVDEAGRVADFHAVGRVTYGTALARAGVSLVQAQRLMRHSTPVLTSNVYTRLELSDARGAVAKLGAGALGGILGGPAGVSPRLAAAPVLRAATGTDGPLPAAQAKNAGGEGSDRPGEEWWRERDSNPRRQSHLIYSQVPLATWVSRRGMSVLVLGVAG